MFVFREDYLAKLSRLFALVPNLRDQHVRLTFPDSSVLKKLIRGPFTCEIPAEHFGHIISEELANKLCAALEERSESGAINLTEVQIAALSLWRDPRMETLFDATPNRAEVVQRLLEGHLTGSLDRLSPGLREPAVAILRHLVTSAGTRNIVLEADLLERLNVAEKISPATGKRALTELTGQSRLVRRQRRNEAYFYDITSEFLVPWIRRQRALSDARATTRKWQKRIGIASAIFFAITGAIVYVLMDQNREVQEKLKDETNEKNVQKVFLNEKAKELVESKEAGESDYVAPPADGPAAQLPVADSSSALEYRTDKTFTGHKGAVWRVHYGPVNSQRGKSNTLITAGHDLTARISDLSGTKDFPLTRPSAGSE